MMACSKPMNIQCPVMNTSAQHRTCFGCFYHIQDMYGCGGSYYQGQSKLINQFTNDELIAELKRRLR